MYCFQAVVHLKTEVMVIIARLPHVSVNVTSRKTKTLKNTRVIMYLMCQIFFLTYDKTIPLLFNQT